MSLTPSSLISQFPLQLVNLTLQISSALYRGSMAFPRERLLSVWVVRHPPVAGPSMVAAVLPLPSQVTWIPPPANSLKINFDGALFKDINKAGLGVVIRNDHGQVIASLSEQIQLPFSSDLVEALAAARAISFAHELSFTNYVLEGDSDVVIKALKHSDDSLSSFGHILASAKTLTDVKCITFSHTRRSGNAVAHNLAKHARHVLGFKVWMEDVPPHLHSVLIADYG
ncbi:uncharacterized protein LOC136071366 [Quercus suber]|uniref:uncharacterized protein LOC136071366 n=1 Tax=Quercus suber TaxID=58331 RepID=UPI0032DFB590